MSDEQIDKYFVHSDISPERRAAYEAVFEVAQRPHIVPRPLYDKAIELRDEAREEVRVLQERIRKVRELCDQYGGPEDAFAAHLAERVLSALDGEDEAARRILAYVVRDPDTGGETGYPPDAVRIVYEEKP